MQTTLSFLALQCGAGICATPSFQYSRFFQFFKTQFKSPILFEVSPDKINLGGTAHVQDRGNYFLNYKQPLWDMREFAVSHNSFQGKAFWGNVSK
jgi:hypothetical protein